MPYALKSAAGPFLAEETRKAAKRWAWEYVAFLLMAFAVGAVAMWRADRWIGKVEAKRIQGAAFMTQLAEENDASALRDYCYAHPTQQGANWLRAVRRVGGRAAGAGQEGRGEMRMLLPFANGVGTNVRNWGVCCRRVIPPSL